MACYFPYFSVYSAVHGEYAGRLKRWWMVGMSVSFADAMVSLSVSMVIRFPYRIKKGTKPENRLDSLSEQSELLVLTLSGCFGLLFSLYAGLLIAFSLAKLGLNARSLALSFETTECAVKRFIFFYSDFCHPYSLPSLRRPRYSYRNLSLI